MFSEVMAAHTLAVIAARSGGRPAETDGGPEPESLRSTVRRAARRSVWDGAVTGTSFVVGYPAALASLYLTQTYMVLAIAAAHGYDASDPVRAAEMLVIRGRCATTSEAVRSLSGAGRPRAVGAGELSSSWPSWRHPVASLRVAAGRLRRTPALDLVLGVMGVASFVVPLIGVPACAYGAARATRRLGVRATEFYAAGPAAPDAEATFTLPPAPTWRTAVLAATATVAVIAVGLILSEVWVGDGHHGLWRIGLAVLWVFVLVAHGRLAVLLWWRRSP